MAEKIYGKAVDAGYMSAKTAKSFVERYVPIMLIAIGKEAKPGHPTVRLAVDDAAFFNEMPKE